MAEDFERYDPRRVLPDQASLADDDVEDLDAVRRQDPSDADPAAGDAPQSRRAVTPSDVGAPSQRTGEPNVAGRTYPSTASPSASPPLQIPGAPPSRGGSGRGETTNETRRRRRRLPLLIGAAGLALVIITGLLFSAYTFWGKTSLADPHSSRPAGTVRQQTSATQPETILTPESMLNAEDAKLIDPARS